MHTMASGWCPLAAAKKMHTSTSRVHLSVPRTGWTSGLHHLPPCPSACLTALPAAEMRWRARCSHPNSELSAAEKSTGSCWLCGGRGWKGSLCVRECMSRKRNIMRSELPRLGRGWMRVQHPHLCVRPCQLHCPLTHTPTCPPTHPQPAASRHLRYAQPTPPQTPTLKRHTHAQRLSPTCVMYTAAPASSRKVEGRKSEVDQLSVVSYR